MKMKRIDAIYDRVLSGQHFSPCLKRVKRLLPKLMDNNINLCNKLNDKLRVSSFINDTELRNQKYLRNYVNSSDNYLRQIKSGFMLNKVIKQNIPKISILSEQISNDCFIKGRNILHKEKTLLKENNELETNLEIDELIGKIRDTLNPKSRKKVVTFLPIKLYKPLSSSDLLRYKNNLNFQIKKDETEFKNKISTYLNDIKKIDIDNPNEMSPFSRNLKFNNKIKFIYFKKPKKIKLKDKEGPNLKSIKHQLFPNLYKLSPLSRNKSLDDINNSNNYVNILNKHSVRKINNFQIFKKINELNKKYRYSSFEFSERDININDNNINKYNEKIFNDKKDSYELLKDMAENKYFTSRMKKKYKIISDLIDIELPNPKEYDKIINENNKNDDNGNDKCEIKQDEDNDNKNENKKKLFLSLENYKEGIYKELFDIKNEIRNLKSKRYNMNLNSYESNKNKNDFNGRNHYSFGKLFISRLKSNKFNKQKNNEFLSYE